MIMRNSRKIMYAAWPVLVLPLVFLYFHYRGLLELSLLILLTILTLIHPRAFSPLAFFRTLVVEIALLPVMPHSVDLSELSVSVPDLKWFFQVLITFSLLFRFVIPVFCVMFIAAYEMHERIELKKYLPFFGIMIFSFVIAVFIPALYSFAFYLFHFMIVVIIADVCEGCLYKNRYSLITNLPYFFLYLTAIYRLRGW